MDDNADNLDGETDKICLPEMDSPDVGELWDLGNAGEVLRRVELDLAYSSEKLLNLDILLMHVAAKESDYESLSMEDDDISDNCVQKGLEFDFLSGVLDSEVRELESFMDSLHPEIVVARKKISCSENLIEASVIEAKLNDSEESLKLSRNQISEMRMQSAKFQRTLVAFSRQEYGNNRKDEEISENGQSPRSDAKLRMQTAEQQRHILRMLEKSLARELSLERRLTDSNLKLDSAEQDIFNFDEASEDALQRLFQAENAVEVLMGISKEMMGRLQSIQFNLNNSVQREGELRLRLQDVMEPLKAEEGALQQPDSSSLKGDNLPVVQLETLQADLEEAERRAETAEAERALLSMANSELHEELNFLKSSDQVDLLEKQLRELDIQLQQAKASAEASQEQQNMLYSAIKDMENLINDLKTKVVKAELRAEKAEAKCAFFSETNIEVNEELSFLRGKMEFLETSLHQADNAKIATAKEINARTKTITGLLLQLAMERERLQKQITSLSEENNILVAKFWKIETVDAAVIGSKSNEKDTETLSKVGSAAVTGSRKQDEAVTESSATSFQMNKSAKDAPSCETEVVGPPIGEPNLETVRMIEPRQLNLKYFLMAALILLISYLHICFKKEGVGFDP